MFGKRDGVVLGCEAGRSGREGRAERFGMM
jgi:hypothetical protein